MKYPAEAFKHGLPKVTEVPECALCGKKPAFVVSNKGIVCGICYQKDGEIREDAIIREAARIVQRRNADPNMPALSGEVRD